MIKCYGLLTPAFNTPNVKAKSMNFNNTTEISEFSNGVKYFQVNSLRRDGKL